MIFDTTVRVQSKTHPEVFIRLRKMTEGRRIKLRQAQSEALAKLQDILVRVRLAAEQKDATEAALAAGGENAAALVTAKVAAALEYEKTVREYSSFRSDVIDPIHVQWGLAGIFDKDGNPFVALDANEKEVVVTPENFMELVPERLYDEVLVMVRDAAGMNQVQEKNSESHTTSNAPEGMATTDTSAAPAEASNCT